MMRDAAGWMLGKHDDCGIQCAGVLEAGAVAHPPRDSHRPVLGDMSHRGAH